MKPMKIKSKVRKVVRETEKVPSKWMILMMKKLLNKSLSKMKMMSQEIYKRNSKKILKELGRKTLEKRRSTRATLLKMLILLQLLMMAQIVTSILAKKAISIKRIEKRRVKSRIKIVKVSQLKKKKKKRKNLKYKKLSLKFKKENTL
jgi:hypothetical protein